MLACVDQTNAHTNSESPVCKPASPVHHTDLVSELDLNLSRTVMPGISMVNLAILSCKSYLPPLMVR